MKHKYFLLSFSLIQIAIYPGIFFTPSVSSSQIIHVYPQVDTLSLWGTCTSPGFRCALTNVSQDTDRIVMYPYASELICGIPLGNITARFDSAFFQVRDSLQLNRYELFYTNLSVYHPTRYQLPFDSTVYAYVGHCALTLRVLRNTAIIDSAVLSFDSYQTGLGVEENNYSIPNKSSLIQNYPNPFNPSTVISYSLSKANNVRIEVFDLLGHCIDILLNQFQQSGNYSFHWEPRTLSSGTYFIRLTSGLESSIIKCQYLK